MNAKDEGQVVRAFGGGTPRFRLFLFHGTDEATGNDLTTQFAAAMGAGADRIDLDGATLAHDTARLADEVCAIAMFGGARWIRVTGGEEVLPAVEAMLSGPKGAPVVVVAGQLKPQSALVKRVDAHPECLGFASRAIVGARAEAIALSIAQRLGLRLGRDVAALVVQQTGGDRAVMASEFEKIALYVDAAPDRPRPVERADIDAIGAAIDDHAGVDLIRALFDGNLAALGQEVGAMAPNAAIPTLRAVGRHALLVARARRGGQLRAGPQERAMAETQSHVWTPAALASAHTTAMAAEAAVKTGGAGDIAAAHDLLTLGRKAARLR